MRACEACARHATEELRRDAIAPRACKHAGCVPKARDSGPMQGPPLTMCVSTLGARCALYGNHLVAGVTSKETGTSSG